MPGEERDPTSPPLPPLGPPPEGNAVFGAMLLQTSASACNSFVFNSGILEVSGAVVVVLVVGVVKLMHVLIDGIMGIMGMTTAKKEGNGVNSINITILCQHLTRHLRLRFCHWTMRLFGHRKLRNPIGDGGSIKKK